MTAVIIPAYNAEKTIEALLDSLLRQEYPEPYEIIVVDDGSTDATVSKVARYKTVRLIQQSNAGPAAARNRGAGATEAEIILFTDADCEAFPDWISEMTRPFRENPETAGTKGAYKTRQKELIARFVQIEYEDKYAKMKKDKYIDFIDTYSAGFRREVFLSAGGYDTTFPVACAEDVDLSYRLSRQGCKMVFNPRALVFHRHPRRLSEYLKKKFKFAYWRVKAVQKSPEKAFKDSHTPWVMKLQALLFPLVVLAVMVSCRNPRILLAVLGGDIAVALPFTVQALRKDAAVGVISPALLFLRSGAQFSGLAWAVIRGRFKRC